MATKERKRLKRNDAVTEENEEANKAVRFNEAPKAGSGNQAPATANFYGNIADTYFGKWSFNDKSNTN